MLMRIATSYYALGQTRPFPKVLQHNFANLSNPSFVISIKLPLDKFKFSK